MADGVKKEHIEAVVNEVKKDAHVMKETAASVIGEVKEHENKQVEEQKVEKNIEENKVEEKDQEKKTEESKKEEESKNEDDVDEPKKEDKRMKAVVYPKYGGGASSLKVIIHLHFS